MMMSEKRIPMYYKEVKLAFCLATHNQENLLLAHLDILRSFPDHHDVLVFYSGKQKLPILHHKYPAQPSHQLGSITAFICALKKTLELNYDVMVYRNGDDWMLNHILVQKHLSSFSRVAGYNWFSQNNDDNIALNNVYVELKHFRGMNFDIDFEKQYCEQYLARLLDIKKGFYRLPGREIPNGIGNAHEEPLDPDNNRWFNREWQLITSHDNVQRGKYWRSIRDQIPYLAQLEKSSWFGAWLESAGCDCPDPALCKRLKKHINNRLFDIWNGIGISPGQAQLYRDLWTRQSKEEKPLSGATFPGKLPSRKTCCGKAANKANP
jgi:hypothetical protein